MNNINVLIDMASKIADFNEVANKALYLMRENNGLIISQGKSEAQSSKNFFKVYSLRREMNYFKNKRIIGLDKTLEYLDSDDVLLSLVYAQLSSSLISIFVDDKNKKIYGIFIIENEKDSSFINN